MEIIITGNDFAGKHEFIKYLDGVLRKVAERFKRGAIHKIHAVCTDDKKGFDIKLDVYEEFDKKGVFVVEHIDVERHIATEGLVKKLEAKLFSLKDKKVTERNHEGFEAKQKAKISPDIMEPVEIEFIVADDAEDIK